MEKSPSVLPQLLVSVKSAAEAKLAQSAGVDWIDLKNPEAGPLGRPDLGTLSATIETLCDWPKLSVALGELSEIESSRTAQPELEMARRFPIAKLALAETWTEQATGDLVARIQNCFPHSEDWLVPVAYGDWQLCAAPPISSVVKIAQELSSRYVLIDTYTKDGRNLLDFVERSNLTHWIDVAGDKGVEVVLAGSLRMRHVEQLWDTGAAAFGIRGAVCNGRRTGDVNLEKILHWTKWIQDRRSPNSVAQI
ncbi:MAG TPA: hypothetical protein DDW52_07540 [Planctomycetaceae bacterium]|nr:hypothetical protein [Planctomycetaceae bacterium]